MDGGRYLRDLEAQLIVHCGGAPTITQRLLIERLMRTTVQLNALDEKLLASDDWTDHEMAERYGPDMTVPNCTLALCARDAVGVGSNSWSRGTERR